MVILRVSSGQANQMYEFAAAYAVAKTRGEELVLDISRCIESAWGYQLDYFNIPDLRKIVYLCSDVKSSLTSPTDIPASLLKHGRVYSDSNPSLPSYNELSEAKALEGDPVILSGYFFNRDRYYKPFWDEVRKLFTSYRPVSLLDKFSQLAEGYETVGIHIRRTDFAVTDWAFMPEDDFFRAAICWYRHILSNPRFFVVSDDIEYAKSILGQDSSIYYINSLGHNEAPVVEFLCLSRCRHKILSNASTFSNLAYELNEDLQKTVVRRHVPGRRSRLREWLKGLVAFYPSGHGPEYSMNTQVVARWAKRYRTDGKNPISNYIQKVHEAINCPEHQIALEKIDELFINVGELEVEARKSLAYRKFVACAALRQPDPSLDLAHAIWFDSDSSPEFHQYYMETLCDAGFSMEAAVEAARCQSEVVADSIAFQNLPAMARDLYTVFTHIDKQRFLIVPYAEMIASSQIMGLISLGVVLRRLGHEVTFLRKTGGGEAENKGETSYIRKHKLLTTRCEVCLGCFQERYEDIVEAQGLENYLKDFCSSDPAVILTRDPALCETANALSLPYIYADFPKGDPESGIGGKLPVEIRAAMEQQAAFVLPSCRDENQGYQFYDKRWSFRQEQRAPEYAIRQAAALCRWLASSR